MRLLKDEVADERCHELELSDRPHNEELGFHTSARLAAERELIRIKAFHDAAVSMIIGYLGHARAVGPSFKARLL